MHYDQIQFNIYKPINITQHINRVRDKKHMVISMQEKPLQHSTFLFDKTPEKLGI
jgi:hypothetical protein